jgi:hypothetical protein
MRYRLARILLIATATAVLAAAGIAVNLVLLQYADSRNDPVGKLTPRATITQPASPPSTPTTNGGGEEPDDDRRDD